MPNQIIRFQCEYCHKRVLASKSRIAAHEKICFYNPEVRSCMTCDHAEENYESSVRCKWCGFYFKDVLMPGSPIRDCAGWTPFIFAEEYSGWEDV